MEYLSAVFLIFMGLYSAHGLRCYECNVYEDRKDVLCAINECPAGYDVCVTTTYKPSAGVNNDCYNNFDNGTSYRGKWATTIYNQECMAWDANATFSYGPEKYGDNGISSHNYCRNPEGDIRPWCYTSLREDFAYCSVPKCFKHLVKVETYSCGWLNKNYCDSHSSEGEKCYQACDSDLCNKPSELKETHTVVAIDTKDSTFVVTEEKDKKPRANDDGGKGGRTDALSHSAEEEDDGGNGGQNLKSTSVIVAGCFVSALLVFFM